MSTGPRVAFKSLGCRVNFEEVECLRGRFLEAGFRCVPFEETAEVYVINTCTVTAAADSESRQQVRRAVRRKPAGGVVAVTGCYAQRDPHALRGLEGVDLVLGNAEKADLFEHVMRVREDRRLAGELWVSERPLTRRFLHHGSTGGPRTRATLKIQDGCDERCTYCIIPSVRGPSVSRPPKEVLEEARALAGLGHREIALTGVNTGCYGRDLGEREGLARLVVALDRLGLGVRFRLNSLEPATVTETLLDALEDSPSFARHFHVPLQHGDSRVLRRMGRTYDHAFYARVIERIHARFPLAGIGADVMAGFPGETEEEFASGRDFLADLPVTYLHVFPYSERSGTPAARMRGQLPAPLRQERAAALRDLDRMLRLRFLARLDGTLEDVLVEATPGPRGRPCGLTGNFVRVELDDPGARENDLVRVLLRANADPRVMRGEIAGRNGP